MSGSLLGIGVAGAIGNGLISVLLRPQRSIGMLVPDVTVSEQHLDTLEVTQHPVEKTADITDHAYMKPYALTIKSAWSNSSYSAIGSLFSGGSVLGTLSDGVFGESYIQQMYAKLQALQQSRVPFDVVTGKRKYTSMLMTGLAVITDNTREYVLDVTITCQQIILVSTSTGKLPPIKQQRDAPITASPLDTGTNQPQPVDTASALNKIGGSIF